MGLKCPSTKMSVCRLNSSWHTNCLGFWLQSEGKLDSCSSPQICTTWLASSPWMFSKVLPSSDKESAAVGYVSSALRGSCGIAISFFLEDKFPWTIADPCTDFVMEWYWAPSFRVKASLSI